MRIYHTLENRENADEVEEYAPYKCRSSSAWMHDGYYFWDQDEELAHFWGKEVHKDNYFICESSYNSKSIKLLDLYNSYNDRMEFNNIYELIKSQNINNGKKILARHIIEFLIKKP